MTAVVEEESGRLYEWFVLRVVTGREYRLRDQIGRKDDKACILWRQRQRRWQEISGVEPWLPECTIRRVLKRVVTRTKQPLFPGHLLLRLDLSRCDIGAIEEMPGALGFVRCNGDQPSLLRPAAVIQLRSYLDRKGGIIIDANSGHEISPWSDLPKGMPVKIVGGLFEGANGVFQEQVGERLKILIDMFDRSVETIIAEAQVVAA